VEYRVTKLGEFSSNARLLNLGSFYEKYIHTCRYTQHGLATFCRGKGHALILTKNVLGYNLCGFFTNSSGRSA
jgi:hypothetical protein